MATIGTFIVFSAVKTFSFNVRAKLNPVEHFNEKSPDFRTLEGNVDYAQCGIMRSVGPEGWFSLSLRRILLRIKSPL
jgi:uncharacterized protein (DUF736 family)